MIEKPNGVLITTATVAYIVFSIFISHGKCKARSDWRYVGNVVKSWEGMWYLTSGTLWLIWSYNRTFLNILMTFLSFSATAFQNLPLTAIRCPRQQSPYGQHGAHLDPVGPSVGPTLSPWLCYMGPLSLTPIIKCGVKLLIHSQTSTVQPLKFRNG